MPERKSPSLSRWNRARALAAATALLVALGGAWTLWRAPLQEAPGTGPTQAGPPSVPAPHSLPPAPDAGVPVPVIPPAAGPAQAEEGAAEDTPEQAAAAHEPPLLSDDTNLSYARRAGLHRAPNPLRLTASAVLAMDAKTGEVIYARNPQAILPIASLTKLLMGIVLLDAQVPLSQTIEITADDVDRLRNSRSRLRVGTTLSRHEALRLALMSSENRAAHALARTFPGGREEFLARMNRKARELGMAHSNFTDPTGLSNANRATVGDVGKLVAAASGYPLLGSLSTTERYQARFGKRRLQYLNSNRLVRHTDWPIRLQKTGYIVEAGQCLAMATKVEGREVVMVLLDAGSVKTRSQDARKLRRWVARQDGGR